MVSAGIVLLTEQSFPGTRLSFLWTEGKVSGQPLRVRHVRPSRLAVLASASAVLLLTACSQSAGTSPSSPPSASGEGQGTALGALTFTSETSAQGQGTIDVAHGGTVTATASDGTRFTLDPGQAEKWVHAIQNPPTRLDKLGVKPGMTILVDGVEDEAFIAELETRVELGEAEEGIDLLFLAAEDLADLDRLEDWGGALAAKGAVWVVAQKGKGAPLKLAGMR